MLLYVVKVLNDAVSFSIHIFLYVSIWDFESINFDLRTQIRLDDVPITSAIIETFLSKLDPNETQGNDKISPFVLYKCSKEWSIPLNLLFNSSMQQGALPNAWLEANATPIFKKGNKMLPENYRPVSLTSVPCKIMEKLVNQSKHSKSPRSKWSDIQTTARICKQKIMRD